MAKKKDFSNVNTDPFYSTIADATAEPLPGQMEIGANTLEAEREAEKVTEPRKPRKGYTQAEVDTFAENLQTTGRKGCKLPRINLAFTPANYDYITTMARAQGVTLTEFCNRIMREHREEHKAVYEKAVEFRNSL
jgi:hypothetical protein